MTKAQHTHRRHPRRSRIRRERQQGAVLFLVLMVLVVTTLSATFAVQYSTANLTGTRGAQDALAARYAAETGANMFMAMSEMYSAAELAQYADKNAEVALTTAATADGGTSTASSFPHARLHVPPMPTDKGWILKTSTEMDAEHYNGVASLTQDPRSPYSLMYDSVLEVQEITDGHTFTVSSWGRSSMDWDPVANTFTGTSDDFTQAGDQTAYHDSVSLARAYYTIMD